MSGLHRNEVAPVVDVQGLTVTLPTPSGELTAVHDLSFRIAAGETLGVVGESGSGKSLSAHALLGLLPRAALWRADRLTVCGVDLLQASDRELARGLRGLRAGMIFQEPMTSLNPVYPVGRQLMETMTLHGGRPADARDRALELLDAVGLPDAKERLGQYPHQFSGGQRQRLMIAMALMNAPQLLIADEPTTALDVTIQAQILELLRELQAGLGLAMLFISHDIGVVASVAQRVHVMLKGEAVESGPTERVLHEPRDPYTRRLIASLPRPTMERARPAAGPALCALEGVAKIYRVRRGVFRAPRRIGAVQDVSLTLAQGETVAIVGESGSGKSTLARLILGLEPPDRGRALLKGVAAARLPATERARLIQPVFQDPYASLNPRMSVGGIIERPLEIHGRGTRAERRERVRAVMRDVGLAPRLYHAFPSQMSGGQRQRVAIARALVLGPEIVVCDEPTSALDVSIQAQILTLLEDLRERLGLTLVLITHDLAVVRRMADRVVVMRDGRIVEDRAAAALFAAPRESYTRSLLAAALGPPGVPAASLA